MKKTLSLILVILMMVLSITVFVPPVEAEAATTYDFLFPVNNGGVNIAFLYADPNYSATSDIHRGLDIYSSGDQTIYAAFSGKVTHIDNACPCVSNPSGCSHTQTWGNRVVIRSEDGLYAVYGHLKQHSMLVSVGEEVTKGQPIASMGSSGFSYNKHLHFELRKNLGDRNTSINVNPTNSSVKPGCVVYSTSGYQPVVSDTISEGTYKFNNDGYRMYMISDKAAKGTIGASTSTANTNFDFKIIKDGNNYRILPANSNNNYLNVYWTATSSSSAQNNFARVGDEITLWSNSTSDYSQKWIFEKCGDGYLIHPACTPAFSITRENNKLVVRQTTRSTNQIWKLEVEECNNHIYTNSCDATCNLCGYTRSTSHTYTNNCDAICNVCGYTRSTSHTYSNDCDDSCNVCGATRSTSHTYSNNCDAICNVCGYTRSTSHTYSNNCDSSCNVCGATRNVSHTYTNGCDDTCDSCGYTRSVSHKYSNSCDNSCNTCGAIRDFTHTYTNDCDDTCNVCSAKRNVKHNYDSDYMYSKYSHWRNCDCGESEATSYHMYSSDCDKNCNVCGYEREEITHTDEDNNRRCDYCDEIIKKNSSKDEDDNDRDDEGIFENETAKTAVIVGASVLGTSGVATVIGAARRRSAVRKAVSGSANAKPEETPKKKESENKPENKE